MSLVKPVGSWVALVTPFTQKGEVDMDGFKKLVDFHVRNGSDGVIFMGSTGEATSLSLEERREIIKEMAPYCRGKIKAFFGTTCSTTKDTVELSQLAEEYGADGIQLVVPPYILPPQEAVYEFIATVARSLSISVTIYNNPSRVVTNIDPATIARLREIPNIVAIKEASPSLSQLVGDIEVAQGKMHVLCCDSPKFGLIIPLMAMGGHGTANVTGNVLPREFALLSKPWESWEDALRCRELFFKYKPVMEAAYLLTNPVGIKAMMKLLGMPSGDPRPPLQPLSGTLLERVKEVIERFNLREKCAI
ncbi:MAG: 4-hydroxy-tetrahydrodipicolinate synthase [Synergistetes bacterium]|nr:4-hydroxy-tetrahydrodipicolinate synthase [Synergistota bacterium]